jgi:hypothetical protein
VAKSGHHPIWRKETCRIWELLEKVTHTSWALKTARGTGVVIRAEARMEYRSQANIIRKIWNDEEYEMMMSTHLSIPLKTVIFVSALDFDFEIII